MIFILCLIVDYILATITLGMNMKGRRILIVSVLIIFIISLFIDEKAGGFVKYVTLTSLFYFFMVGTLQNLKDRKDRKELSNIFTDIREKSEQEAKRKEYATERRFLQEKREREEQEIRDKERQKRETEIKAMNVVIDYEKKASRNPIDVSAENLGYDIKASSSVETRLIEVKGLNSSYDYSSYILLTANEKKKANELANNYYLYVVYNCSSSYPELIIVQNPDYKLSIDRTIDTNKYKIYLKDMLQYNIAEVYNHSSY